MKALIVIAVLGGGYLLYRWASAPTPGPPTYPPGVDQWTIEQSQWTQEKVDQDPAAYVAWINAARRARAGR